MFLRVNGGDTYMIRFKLSSRRLHIYRVLHECGRSGQGLQNSQDAQVDNFFQKVCKGLPNCGLFAQILLSQNARKVPKEN
jgi:hypothetical protein